MVLAGILPGDLKSSVGKLPDPVVLGDWLTSHLPVELGIWAAHGDAGQLDVLLGNGNEVVIEGGDLGRDPVGRAQGHLAGLAALPDRGVGGHPELVPLCEGKDNRELNKLNINKSCLNSGKKNQYCIIKKVDRYD